MEYEQLLTLEAVTPQVVKATAVLTSLLLLLIFIGAKAFLSWCARRCQSSLVFPAATTTFGSGVDVKLVGGIDYGTGTVTINATPADVTPVTIGKPTDNERDYSLEYMELLSKLNPGAEEVLRDIASVSEQYVMSMLAFVNHYNLTFSITQTVCGANKTKGAKEYYIVKAISMKVPGAVPYVVASMYLDSQLIPNEARNTEEAREAMRPYIRDDKTVAINEQAVEIARLRKQLDALCGDPSRVLAAHHGL